MKLAVINSETWLRKGCLVSRTQRPQGKPITPSLEGLVEHWLGDCLATSSRSLQMSYGSAARLGLLSIMLVQLCFS